MLLTAKKIQTMIADDHALIRQGFKETLSSDTDIELVGEARDGLELLELLENQQPHVILLDIQMPRMNGIVAGKLIKEKYPAIHLIALSISDDDHYIKAMIKAGAKGYLLKNIEPTDLLTAVKTVNAGGHYYSTEIGLRIEHLLSAEGNDKDHPKAAPVFSATEIIILKLLCKGLTCKEIGAAIHLAKKTVEHYKERIQEKMGAKNATEIAVYAILNKIVLKSDLL